MKTFESIIINDTLAEGLMIYASLYFTFAFGNLIGEIVFWFLELFSKFSYLGLSGPIAIMAYNIFFDHSNISREAELTVKRFYDVITFFWAIYLSGSVGFVWVEQLWDHVLASDSHVSGKLFPSGKLYVYKMGSWGSCLSYFQYGKILYGLWSCMFLSLLRDW